ncbi:rab GTPase-binding effector protein 2 [Neosynchiropus ocellatus]
MSSDPEAGLRAQLAECRAQVERWQGVAAACEQSKQEELAQLRERRDQETQSLQEALRETAERYEARIALLQSESRAVQTPHTGGAPRSRAEAASGDPEATPANLEAADGFFSLRHADSASLSSFSLDTPSFPRKLHAQDDTDSLVSTGTLVPEAIYLPPAGHRLVAHGDWDSLTAQVSDLREEVRRLLAEKEELEKELDSQAERTHKQVSTLQAQVLNSESLLQDLHKSLTRSQNAVQSRLAELSLSQRKVCTELCRLKGEQVEEESGASWAEQLQVSGGERGTRATARGADSAYLQAAHSEERLRIEIVNLREQLAVRAEENVQFSSLKTETDRIQAQRDQLQSDLLSCRTELEGLRVALSHIQSHNKALGSDKGALQQQCLELRSQVISLRAQVDTSQTVQRDFVQLSQSLQVKLEQVRQAETLQQVREVLEDVNAPATPPAGDP